MCGRFALFAYMRQLIEEFGLDEHEALDETQRFNIAPSQRVIAIVNDGETNSAPATVSITVHPPLQPITNGTVLGIDFGVADGSAAADNWNVIATTASGSLAAGTMIELGARSSSISSSV